jgi:hypothetical protein
MNAFKVRVRGDMKTAQKLSDYIAFAGYTVLDLIGHETKKNIGEFQVMANTKAALERTLTDSGYNATVV